LGIDFCYFGPAKKCISIGIVASMDKEISQFWTQNIIIQDDPGRKVVDSLTQIVKEAVSEWKRRNENYFPDSLLVYRDGLSSNQQKPVLEVETRLI
jgi:hypothetical protein